MTEEKRTRRKVMPAEGNVVEEKRTDGRSRSDGRRSRRRTAMVERDILRVDGLSPEYVHRWVLEKNFHYMFANDWDVVNWDEIENVGDLRANSPNPSEARVSIRTGSDVLVLMKKYKDWYADDTAEKQRKVDETELGMKKDYGREIQRNGTYGSVTIGED